MIALTENLDSTFQSCAFAVVLETSLTGLTKDGKQTSCHDGHQVRRQCRRDYPESDACHGLAEMQLIMGNCDTLQDTLAVHFEIDNTLCRCAACCAMHGRTMCQPRQFKWSIMIHI